MKHYKDINNNLFGIEDGASVPEGLIEVSMDEVHGINEQSSIISFNDLTPQQKRVLEYPSIGDQLDALFHAGVFPSDMADKIQAIKDKYPKV